jgi:hypothetical protein
VPKVRSDYVFHPPSGSSVPGKVDANPYVFYPPSELRRLIESEKNADELKKIKSALKQWERLYVDQIGYPYRLTQSLRAAAYKVLRLAEISGPAQNLFQYQDAEVPEGYEGIIEEGMKNLHDRENQPRFQIKAPNERVVHDNGTDDGDFLSPSDGVADPVRDPILPRGQGEDPEGLDYPDMPSGGEPGHDPGGL